MAQEKLIVYDSLPAKAGLVLCTLSLPLWGLMAPVALAIMSIGCIFALFYGVIDQTIGVMGHCLALALFFLGGVIVTGMFSESNIAVSQEGLTLPALTSITNKFDRFIEWSEIEKVTLLGDNLTNLNSLKLHIKVQSGGYAVLGLNGLVANDVEYILVSMANWLPAKALDSKLEQLKEALWNANSASDSKVGTLLSFTSMWEDELTSRFAASAYVPLNPGQKLQDGNLKVIRQLALGGWSAVYLVQEANTKLRVLKESVIPPRVNAKLKEKAQSMFLREAHLLLKLEHPRIVRVHEHFIEDERHYLLLDYISGQNIRQTVSLQGAFHQLDVIDFAKQLCDVLQFLHSQDPVILHRDLTPDNIVIGEDGKLILIDFGAANEMIGTATGTLVGKQCYISPEQFRGRPSEASDLYALGATLHFMLTGRDPEPLTQSSPRDLERNITAKLDELVQTLTAQDLKDRASSAAEVRELLLSL
ncbi:MAG: serine/threonine-protein kinase [Candidatus Obscuribacterales bacterium]|jgi:serine/threonine-protein kinase